MIPNMHRENLIRAVATDLVGPHGADDEQFLAVGGQNPPRPDDVYLTGLLLPLEPERLAREVASEADEPTDDGTSAAIDEDAGLVADARDIDSNDPGEGVPAILAARPSVMGLSVAVGAATKSVDVTIRAARYAPFWTDDTGTRTFEQGQNDSRSACWVRCPVVATAVVKLDGADIQPRLVDVSLTPVTGSVDGLRCRARTLRIGDVLHVTVSLENTLRQAPGAFARCRDTWFQTDLELRAPAGFVPRPDNRGGEDEDRKANRLLYRNIREWAVGHTCSATWDNPEGPSVIATSWIPSQLVLSMSADGNTLFAEKRAALEGTDSAAELSRAPDGATLAARLEFLPAAYDAWLTLQEARIPTLPAGLQAQARSHCERARKALERMREGLRAIRTDGMAFEAFRLANEAMELQTAWKPVENEAQIKAGQKNTLSWRPFQMGFILCSLPGLVWPRTPDGEVSDDRRSMDLLWFPTGGGKTEAYLGLSAFTLFFRRLRDRDRPGAGAGVTILMRYTLRLLTTQQFERAAAMILACEVLRRRHPSLANGAPFSIGLWVGNSTTPPSVFLARKSPINRAKAAMLAKCPGCQSKLAWDPDHRQGGPWIVACGSKRASCTLARETFGALPIHTIDELVFDHAPSLVLGTVDKFAQIVRTQSLQVGPGPNDMRRLHGGSHLFGIAQNHRPPELIIQDELHLISGPLGTITAIYEAAIDRICTFEGVPPKIVGSTATIRRAEDQVRRLFDRTVFQFPPPVIDHDDSCFAVVDRNVPGRVYLGVSTAGRSAKFTLASLAASILQRAHEDAVIPPSSRDPWWTLLLYFNSLRELGGALVMLHDDVPAAIGVRATLAGSPRRRPTGITELTSRISSEDIPTILEGLKRRWNAPTSPQEYDVVLATNMISVGVDIPRLGVMVVNGQPRSMSEYIQATSRVGRNKVPGLVVTAYNAARPRDLSHFEAFRTWHGALYREVEATSVTPWAARAREKALHAAVVALARHLDPELTEDASIAAAQHRESHLLQLAHFLVARARASDDAYPEHKGVEVEVAAFIRQWRDRASGLKRYWNDFKPAEALLYSWEEEARRRQVGSDTGAAQPTPNSMRDVEPSVWFRLVSNLSSNPS
jgi:hypothetical protein